MQPDPDASAEPAHKAVGSIVALGGGEIAARLVAFVATAYIAHVVGPTGFGILGLALAISWFLILAVQAGFPDIGTHEVARRPDRAYGLAAGSTVVRLGVALVAFACLAILAWVLHKGSQTKLVLLLTGLSFFSLALDTSWAYKGLERNRRVGVALVLRQLLYAGLVLATVRGAGDLLFVPLAQFLAEAVAALWLGMAIFRVGRARIDVRAGLKILKGSGSVTLSRLFRTCIITADVVLIGFMLGEREVGLYTAPYRICFLVLSLAATIQISYLPALARATQQGRKRLAEVAGRSMEMACGIGIPIVVGGMLLAGPLLYTTFGTPYLEGTPAFRLLILSVGIVFLIGVLHNIFVVRNGLRTEMRIVGLAAMLNLGLNLVLIPAHGLIGAASATVASEFLILALGFAAVRRAGVKLPWQPVLKPLLASLAMAAALIALGPGIGLVWRIPAGGIVYCLALVAFRGVPRDVQPHMKSALSFFHSWLQKCRRGIHFKFASKAKLAAQASKVLASRDYYHLFDDVYREVRDHQGSDEREREHAPVRKLVDSDFESLRAAKLLPEPPARLVDLGCGEGQHAVGFGLLGYQVTGVDVSPTAVEAARRAAAERDIGAEFLVADVLELEGLAENSFDIATDIGCLHMLVRREHRQRYLRTAGRVLRSGGVFFLFNKVSQRDVEIADEELYIQRMVTHVEVRWVGNDGSRLRYCAPGFRSASLGQYEEELHEAGFSILRSRPGLGTHLPYAMILARKP